MTMAPVIEKPKVHNKSPSRIISFINLYLKEFVLLLNIITDQYKASLKT